MRPRPALFFLLTAPLLGPVLLGCETPTAATRPVATAPSKAVLANPDTALVLRVARERFADTTHVRSQRSSDGRFVLVLRSAPTTALHPIVLTSYAIVERSSGRVTASEQDVSGTVRWLNATTVEVTLSVGTVQGDPSAPIGAQPGPPRVRIDAATGAKS